MGKARMQKMAVLFFVALSFSLKADPVLPIYGDIFPPGTPGTMNCGDGVVNALDIDEGGRIIENMVIPTACQLVNGDVPNGVPEFCGYPPGTSNCAINGVFDIFDYMVIVDKAMGRINCCDHCFTDTDSDGLINELDNCADTPNGPFLGTCAKTITGVVTTGRGLVCDTAGVCTQAEFCQMHQEDYNGNGVGDVCECYGDFNLDGDCDGSDAAIFKNTFGRNLFYRPCPAPR